MTTQLRNITTGTVDFGVRRTPNAQSHYFKDFELELYVAAQCINDGVHNVALNPVSNAPDGDLFLESLRCEVKHPNSLGHLRENLKDFNEEIRNRNMYGVFVTGIEDMFNVFPPLMFPDDATFQSWLTRSGRRWTFTRGPFIAWRLGGSVFSPQSNSGRSGIKSGALWQLWREGNSIVLDHRFGVPAQQYLDADALRESLIRISTGGLRLRTSQQPLDRKWEGKVACGITQTSL